MEKKQLLVRKHWDSQRKFRMQMLQRKQLQEERQENKLIRTVKIWDDAVFTNGEKVTAEDVAFTYTTAKESGSDIDITMIEDISAQRSVKQSGRITE